MFILSALELRGPFHAAKVMINKIMCNSFLKIIAGFLAAIAARREERVGRSGRASPRGVMSEESVVKHPHPFFTALRAGN